jgi:hypothetical protein
MDAELSYECRRAATSSPRRLLHPQPRLVAALASIIMCVIIPILRLKPPLI